MRRGLLAFAWLLASLLAPPVARGATVDVTYVANEGVMVASGGHKVLVDCLFRAGVAGYAKPEQKLRERVETAAPPFDGVALILITHFHPDHFDPEAVVRHLRHDPAPLVLTTTEAAEQVLHVAPELHGRVRALQPAAGTSVEVIHAGVRVEAFALHHGRDRPISNLGFRVTMAGVRWLHVGDAQSTAEELRSVGLDGRSVDVAFLPTWLLLDDGWQDVPALFRDARVVAIHVPIAGAPAEWFGDAGSPAGMAAAVRRAIPGALVLTEPGDGHRLTIPAPLAED